MHLSVRTLLESLAGIEETHLRIPVNSATRSG
jgi:hypothetical protein